MKSIRRIVFLLTFSALAAGCAHQDQRPERLVLSRDSLDVLAKYEMARHSLLTCGNAVYDDPKFSLLTAHIPFNPDLSSLAQLSDQHLATNEEMALLFNFDSAFVKCPTAYLEQMRTIVPAMAMIAAEGYAKNEYITADLIERKLTWGDYDKIRKKNYDDAVQLLTLEFNRVLRGTGPESETDPVLRKDVSVALMRYYQSLKIVPGVHARSAKPSS